MEIPQGHRFQRHKIHDRNATLAITVEKEHFKGYVLVTSKLS